MYAACSPTILYNMYIDSRIEVWYWKHPGTGFSTRDIGIGIQEV